MTRREFLMAMLGSGLLLTACGTEREPVDNFSKLEVKNLRQIITADPSTSRTIIFQADEPLNDPIVKVQLNDAIRSIKAVDCSFDDDDHTHHQYSARIDNLKAGAAYKYRVVDGTAQTDWHDLSTHDGNSFKALIFPDSQCADYGVWASVARAAHEKNPDAEFFINVGDIVDNGEDRTQWQAWFDGAPFIDRIPFVPVMGNHETYNRQWEVREPVAYLKLFEVPSNNSAAFDRYYYSFDRGDVHWIVLNTEPFAGLIDEQKAWLRADVGASDRKWRVVLLHRDVLQYRIIGRPERQEGISESGQDFMPLFDELGIDLVLSAHLHTYRNRGRIFNFERSERGALYILTGLAGDVRYPIWIDHELDEYVAPQPETDNYLTLEANGDELIVKCFLPDGRELDRAVVTKS